MYLYSTSVRPGAAHPAKVMEWAMSLTKTINDIAEVPSALWTSFASPGVGTLTWTSVVPDLSLIEATEAKLAADPAYQDLVASATDLVSTSAPVDQMLVQLVHGDRDAATIDGRFASTVMATLAPGAMAKGIQLGVAVAQQVKAITGLPTSFGVGATGTYGQVMWVSLAENVSQLQKGYESLNADADFSRMLDEDAAEAYLPGAVQTISRKLA